MAKVEYIDSLPKLNLDYEKVNQALSGKNLHHVPDNIYYGIFEPYTEIGNLGKELFGETYQTRLHAMWQSHLPVHKDTNRKFAYNYIIDPGGDNVITRFFDDNMKIVEEYVIEPNRWHKMDVTGFHGVFNMTRTRTAITVYPVERTYHAPPIVEFEYPFNKELIMSEFRRLWELPDPHYEFYKNGERKVNTWSGLRVLGTQTYGEALDTPLLQEGKRFCEHYGITDDFIVLFMWMDKQFQLSWHIDDASVCKSSVNLVLSDNPVPVHFREGQFKYKCAVFDIMQEHAVFNDDEERLLMRISFKNLNHSELTSFICPQYSK